MELNLEVLGRLIGGVLLTFLATRVVQWILWTMRSAIRQEAAVGIAAAVVAAIVLLAPRGAVQLVDTLTFYITPLLAWVAWDLVRARRRANRGEPWRPGISRVLAPGTRVSRGAAAVGSLLLGSVLAVVGALSFEHELTGTVGHPIAVVAYPAWAKATVAVGVALVVGGIVSLTRRSNHPRPSGTM